LQKLETFAGTFAFSFSKKSIAMLFFCNIFAIEKAKKGCTRQSSSELGFVLVCTSFAAEIRDKSTLLRDKSILLRD